MALIRPGISSSRATRSSRLILGWRASDGGLNPYTGQVTLFSTAPGSAVGPVVGLNGNSISGGSGMGRFTHADADLIPRLELRGDSGSFDTEQPLVPLTVPTQALSILVRVVSLYAKGSSVTPEKHLLTWGSDPNVSAGTWVLSRSSTAWVTRRSRGGSVISSTQTEPGTITYPVDVLATQSAAGALTISTRDAAGVLATGSPSTLAALVTAGELLQGLGMGCSAISGLTGGWWRLEAVKIARGVQTFTTMDGLS